MISALPMVGLSKCILTVESAAMVSPPPSSPASAGKSVPSGVGLPAGHLSGKLPE